MSIMITIGHGLIDYIPYILYKKDIGRKDFTLKSYKMRLNMHSSSFFLKLIAQLFEMINLSSHNYKYYLVFEIVI
jgi:hypothetical protein